MCVSDLPLQKLTHESGKHVDDSGFKVFHAPTTHSFIQAAGYLKHTRAKKANKGVFFRGQTKLFPEFSPTLLRGIKQGPSCQRRLALIGDFLQEIETSGNAMRAVPSFCREALLQHYGVKTTWIDVVDNMWIALWFACHNAITIGRSNEYLHFEKRMVEPGKMVAGKYAYVILLESAYFTPVEKQHGNWIDDRSETIDLRISAPSQFVRPHAQHGLLIRRLSNNGLPVCDFSPLIVGIIRVDLMAALDWLGSASTLSVHSLFPPAFYDYGYRELLEHIHPGKNLGCIHHIQP